MYKKKELKHLSNIYKKTFLVIANEKKDCKI